MAEETQEKSEQSEQPRSSDRPAEQRGGDRGGARGPDRGGDRRGGDRRGGPGGGRGGPRRRFRRGKVCAFCVGKVQYVDYKDLERLRRYLTDRGKILPRRITGNCARHQRMLCRAVKRARSTALIPYKVK